VRTVTTVSLAGLVMALAIALAALAVLALLSYNRLQHSAQEVKEQTANLFAGWQCDDAGFRRRREVYNAAVKAHNSLCRGLPSAWVARLIGFRCLPYLDVPAAPAGDAPVQPYFYLPPGGVPQGPAAMNQLRAMLADGRLPATALAAPAGSDEWQPIESVLARAGPDETATHPSIPPLDERSIP